MLFFLSLHSVGEAQRICQYVFEISFINHQCAAEIIAQRTVRQDKDSFGTLITIDPDGSPVPTTISPSLCFQQPFPLLGGFPHIECGSFYFCRKAISLAFLVIDPDGSPVPTTIIPSRSEGIRWITFCTGRGAPSPVRLDQNNKAAVCLNSFKR